MYIKIIFTIIMFFVVFKSAAQDSIQTKNISTEVSVLFTPKSGSDMFLKGKEDATLYYKGYKTAGVGTFVTSMITGPVFGLIPAIACSSAEPLYKNLNYPSTELMKNTKYAQGYFETAKKVKSKKVWKNYVLGSAIYMISFFILNKQGN